MLLALSLSACARSDSPPPPPQPETEPAPAVAPSETPTLVATSSTMLCSKVIELVAAGPPMKADPLGDPSRFRESCTVDYEELRAALGPEVFAARAECVMAADDLVALSKCALEQEHEAELCAHIQELWRLEHPDSADTHGIGRLTCMRERVQERQTLDAEKLAEQRACMHQAQSLSELWDCTR